MSAMREQPVWRGIFVLLVAAVLGVPAQAKYSGGSGTAQDPYRIASKKDLLALAAETGDYGAHFVLTADIDLTGQTFTRAVIAPATKVGPNGEFLAVPFTGTFDGKGHKLTGLTIKANNSWPDYFGLFGCIARGSRVRDLNMEREAVTGGRLRIGGLVGLNDGGAIRGCRIAGEVSTKDANEVGALAGGNGAGGTITDCHAGTGTTSGAWNVGGLVGRNAVGAKVTRCDAAGNIDGQGARMGGLVGFNQGTIAHSHATGNLTYEGFLGGFSFGGLVGRNEGTIIHCYASGSVTVRNEPPTWLGGLVGGNSRAGVIANCYATGDVIGNGTPGAVGGLVAENAGFIGQCHATGSVTGGRDNAGGLAGQNPGSITTSYATGSVTVTRPDPVAGGLTGVNGGPMVNCYATGAVAAPAGTPSVFTGVGGLAGNNSGPITNCYAAGNVTSVSSATGGLIAWLSPKGEVVGSFWDVQTSGQSTSQGGTGKTTAQMQTAKTYLDASWDFTNIWDIEEGRTYPFLRPGLAGDLNGDKKVDLRDFARLAANWSKTCGVAAQGKPPLPQCPLAGDVNWDKKVDEYDLRIMAAQWLDRYE
jgi:hypothetical protein